MTAPSIPGRAEPRPSVHRTFRLHPWIGVRGHIVQSRTASEGHDLVRRLVAQARAAGCSTLNQMAAWLNACGHRTPRDHLPWTRRRLSAYLAYGQQQPRREYPELRPGKGVEAAPAVEDAAPS